MYTKVKSCVYWDKRAGKSTTINMLTGALGWDGGGIYADFLKGKSIHDDLPAYKRRLGVVPQDLAIYEDLSARNNVEFFASLYGLRGRSTAGRMPVCPCICGTDRQGGR